MHDATKEGHFFFTPSGIDTCAAQLEGKKGLGEQYRALQQHQRIVDPTKSFEEFIRKPAHKPKGMTHL